jgi:ammonia channel protein AmtB
LLLACWSVDLHTSLSAFVKPKFGYDDALDVFGCHGIGENGAHRDRTFAKKASIRCCWTVWSTVGMRTVSPTTRRNRYYID